MNIYAQPRTVPYAVQASVPVDGPIREIDPTFMALRMLYPDPEDLIRLDMNEIWQELPIWGDIRIGGRDLFTTWSGNPSMPGYSWGLVCFALTLGWMLDQVTRDGSTHYDPDENGTILKLRLDEQILLIESVDRRDTLQVALADAWNAVHGINGRVRAFLLSLDRRFIDHPELGPWVRGETRTVS